MHARLQSLIPFPQHLAPLDREIADLTLAVRAVEVNAKCNCLVVNNIPGKALTTGAAAYWRYCALRNESKHFERDFQELV